MKKEIYCSPEANVLKFCKEEILFLTVSGNSPDIGDGDVVIFE